MKQTRDRILEAALGLFSKKGFLGATTRQIAEEAGTAEVTLFRHFSSKERLFEEVINTYTFLPALRELLPEVERMPYEDALACIARRYLDALALRGDLVRIMQTEVRRYPEKVHRVYQVFIEEMFGTLASYLARMQQRGALRSFDSALGARAFLGLFFSYFNLQGFLRKRQRASDRERAVREFVGIFVRGTLA
jgi:AcrR family transcriptional regulator